MVSPRVFLLADFHRDCAVLHNKHGEEILVIYACPWRDQFLIFEVAQVGAFEGGVGLIHRVLLRRVFWNGLISERPLPNDRM